LFRRRSDRFERSIELSLESADVLTTPLLPELEMSLHRVFPA
jgi:hypothetical protein